LFELVDEIWVDGRLARRIAAARLGPRFVGFGDVQDFVEQAVEVFGPGVLGEKQQKGSWRRSGVLLRCGHAELIARSLQVFVGWRVFVGELASLQLPQRFCDLAVGVVRGVLG